MERWGKHAVVGIDHGVGTLACDIVDLFRQIAKIVRVESPIKAIRSHAFAHEVDTEKVHPTVDKHLEHMSTSFAEKSKVLHHKMIDCTTYNQHRTLQARLLQQTLRQTN